MKSKYTDPIIGKSKNRYVQACYDLGKKLNIPTIEISEAAYVVGSTDEYEIVKYLKKYRPDLVV